jgi:hypothetical protein
MSAFTKLAEFNRLLPKENQSDYLDTLYDYLKEIETDRNKLIEDYERIIRGTQDMPQYEVVAVAGTADMLLSNPLNTVEGC